MPAACAVNWTNWPRIPTGGTIDVTPLRGRPGLRLRVGPWRVIFERDEEARKIDVLRIGPRGDVYKELGGTP